MIFLVIGLVAFLASALTFFSGFGLGTLLLPAFALFFPVPQAIALTAVVHFLNGLFKLALVGRHADRGVVLRFGVPALLAAVLGAWVLTWLSTFDPLYAYTLGDRVFSVTPVKCVIGVLLLWFALMEGSARLRAIKFGPRVMPIGGALSGFFGGLAGMQGALRSAFLARAGLSKEAFIGSGVVIACMIDLSRLGVYAESLRDQHAHLDYRVLGLAVACAFLGAWLGNRHLKKMTMPGIQRLVAVMLFAVALGLISGLL